MSSQGEYAQRPPVLNRKIRMRLSIRWFEQVSTFMGFTSGDLGFLRQLDH
jgi:hypothetical protein